MTDAAPAKTGAAPNPMRQIRVVKVVINTGVGESGEPRTRAEKVLSMLTGQKPIATRSHATNRDLGIRLGQEIGAKVTLRGTSAHQFLDRAFEARDRVMDPVSIDRAGNFSFGIADYTDFTGLKYDPQIGIVGLDVCVEMGRPGYRVRDRRVAPHAVPRAVRVTREETKAFLAERFRVTYLE